MRKKGVSVRNGVVFAAVFTLLIGSALYFFPQGETTGRAATSTNWAPKTSGQEYYTTVDANGVMHMANLNPVSGKLEEIGTYNPATGLYTSAKGYTSSNPGPAPPLRTPTEAKEYYTWVDSTGVVHLMKVDSVSSQMTEISTFDPETAAYSETITTTKKETQLEDPNGNQHVFAVNPDGTKSIDGVTIPKDVAKDLSYDKNTKEVKYRQKAVDLQNTDETKIMLKDGGGVYFNGELVIESIDGSTRVTRNGYELWSGRGEYQPTGQIATKEGTFIGEVKYGVVAIYADTNKDGTVDKDNDKPAKIIYSDGSFEKYTYSYDKATGDYDDEKTKSTKYDKNYWPIKTTTNGVTVQMKYFDKDGKPCGPENKECSGPQKASSTEYFIDDKKVMKDCSAVTEPCITVNELDLDQKNAYESATSSVKWSRVGTEMEKAYNAALGGRALSILFGLDNSEWRRAMDSFFVHSVLGSVISGKWEETLCHYYIDRAPAGTMYIEIPDGANMVGIGAHIEAEKSEPGTYVNASGTQTEYFYKISIFVKNPQEPSRKGSSFVQQLDFNVQLSGERTVWLFKERQKVSPGQTFTRTGSSMITQRSSYRYNTICIKFVDTIYAADGTERSEVCNRINTYTGPATGMPTQASGTSSGSSASSATNQI